MQEGLGDTVPDKNSHDLVFQNSLSMFNKGLNKDASNQGHGFAFSDLSGLLLDNVVSILSSDDGLKLDFMSAGGPEEEYTQAEDVTVKDSAFKFNGAYGIFDNTAPNVVDYINNRVKYNGTCNIWIDGSCL